LDLKVKWTAHYAHENWVDIAADPNNPEIHYVSGPTLALGIPFTEQQRNFDVVYRQKVSIQVATIYGGSGSLPLTFEVHKHHIGISNVRDAFDATRTLERGENNQDNHWEGTWNGIIPGSYDVVAVAFAHKRKGYIDIWNKKGEKGLGLMTFVPTTDYDLKAITTDDLAGQN
jgi:hypothetical protein